MPGRGAGLGEPVELGHDERVVKGHLCRVALLGKAAPLGGRAQPLHCSEVLELLEVVLVAGVHNSACIQKRLHEWKVPDLLRYT